MAKLLERKKKKELEKIIIAVIVVIAFYIFLTLLSALKVAVVDIYHSRLKERQRRKK